MLYFSMTITCFFCFIWKEIWEHNLIQCGPVMPNGITELDQQWFRLWLVVWWHQTIIWTNVDLSSVTSNDNHLKAILQKIPLPSISKISLKMTYQKFHSNLQGANELSCCSCFHASGHKTNWWLNATLQYLQCVSNGDTGVITLSHWKI